MSEDEKENRKATDILLGLDNKVNTLMNQLNLLNNNYKILLAKISELTKTQPQQEKQPQFKIEAADVVKAENTIPQNLAGTPDRRGNRTLPQQQKLQGEVYIKPEEKVSLADVELSISEKVKQARLEASKINDGATKPINGSIPIIQKIVDKNNKAIFMATVIIKNQNGNVVFTTKTNGNGSWKATLDPGKYFVQITKNESLNRPKIDVTNAIIITGENEYENLSDLRIT